MKKLFTFLLLSATTFVASAQSSIANGAICPNITITDTKGTAHKLYDYCNAGNYVVIDFFAYWCGPCKATAPTIEALYKKYGCNSGKLIVLGNECDAAGTLATLQTFDTQAGLDPVNTYPSTYGSIGGSANGSTYGVGAYPTIILVGPDKKMINNDIWPISSIADIEAKFPTGSGIAPKACAAPASVNGIEDAAINVIMSPNPASERLNIQSEGISHISLINQMGQTVLSFNFKDATQVSLDVAGLSEGVYFAEVKTQKGAAIRKFSKY